MKEAKDISCGPLGDQYGGAASPHPPAKRSIYDTYSMRQRWTILAAISFAAILAPFSDTIYLPALTVVAAGLDTTLDLVTTSVSIYMYFVGGAVLVWGPLCDRYGRRVIYLSSAALFLAASAACAAAPSIGVLIAFRALQGAAVTTLSTCGQGVIADVFPPGMRGLASGVMIVPMMLGPILGPVLGGGLSQALGWRATFVALVVYGALVLLALFFLLPETHQWYVLQRLQKADPDAAAQIAEAPSIARPAFPSPLAPLRIVLSPSVVLHMLNLLAVFSFLFSTVTIMPIAFARPPFSLPQAVIGVAYLPGGLGSLVFAPIAGWLTDRLARKYHSTAVRLVPGTLASLTLLPATLVGYGWSLAAGSLAGALACGFLMGVGCSFAMPGLFGWLTIVQQGAPAAAMAGANCVLNLGAGSFIQAATPGTAAMGYGPFLSMLAGIQLLCAAAAAAALARQIRGERALRAVAAAAGGGGGASGRAPALGKQGAAGGGADVEGSKDANSAPPV